MKIITLEKEVVDDGSGPYRKKTTTIKGPKSPYPTFDRMIDNFHKNLLELGRHFNVENVIGNKGSRNLYSKEGLIMNWIYSNKQKNSGNHDKYDGIIKINESSKLAVVEVKNGFAVNIIIYNHSFKDKIKNHSDMPLYKEISDIL